MIAKRFSKGIKESFRELARDKKGIRKIIFYSFLVIVIYVVSVSLRPDYGASYVKKSTVKIIQNEGESASITEIPDSDISMSDNKSVFHAAEIDSGHGQREAKAEYEAKSRRDRSTLKIQYRAPQVIVRDKLHNDGDMLPVGTNLLGTLLMSIDTRVDDTNVRVVLPYGSKNIGGLAIPAQTIFFGNFRPYQGGKRIFVRFTSCIFPDGNEYQLEAQALDSSDYRSGIIGEYHSNSSSRIATTLGLSMVAGVSEVFTEKVVLGDGYSVAPKATLKNAFAQGTAKAANTELEKQVGEMGRGGSEYLTIESTKEVIVSLTKAFRGEKIAK